MTDVTQFEGLANEVRLNADPEVRATLEAIVSPEARFIAASDLANKHYKNNREMERLRDKRRRGMAVLHITHGWPKARIVRELNAPDRRMVSSALDLVDDRQLPNWTEATALKNALTAHEEYVTREATGTTAREVRRVLIIEMTGGRYGRVWTNADLARMSGLTTAAVAQIRTGKVNPSKSELRARKARIEAMGGQPADLESGEQAAVA